VRVSLVSGVLQTRALSSTRLQCLARSRPKSVRHRKKRDWQWVKEMFQDDLSHNGSGEENPESVQRFGGSGVSLERMVVKLWYRTASCRHSTALHSLHDTNTGGGANASTESKALNSW
jgi:hypothetical protein